MTPDIAFVGLGAMGGPMAGHLAAAGFQVQGFDIDAAAVKRMTDAGGSAASSSAGAAKGAALLILMVVDARQAEGVLFEDGALDALQDGATVALMSTCLPVDVTRLADRVAARGRHFCDASVSGGRAGAQTADLTIMAAGSDAAFGACADAFQAMGSRIVRVGDQPGQGAVAKTVNQLLCGVHLAAAGEALALAERMHLDMSAMLEIVGGSAASSWMLRDRGPRMIGTQSGVTSKVDIFVKDLGIVLETAAFERMALPLAAAAHQMFLASSGRGDGDLDDSQVICSWRRLSGSTSG